MYDNDLLPIRDYIKMRKGQSHKCAICDTIPINNRLLMRYIVKTREVLDLVCQSCKDKEIEDNLNKNHEIFTSV